jgi:hypothetical protein
VGDRGLADLRGYLPGARPAIIGGVVPGRAWRWVIGLTVAAAVVLAGVASLLVGLAVAVGRDSAGAGLTGQAEATVLATDYTGDGARVLVRFEPAEGEATEADVAWTASDAPRPGDHLTVAFDPGRPARDPRPFADVDPTGGWAAEWHPGPWYAGGALGAVAALVAVVATGRWAARARAARPARE